ncbi:hypothetical protein [Variovorax boronicumulans]|uniref:hypothetical protein n=1 Tax=Variovorax boronicumulans TaxID=436515 RepID=UPI00339AB368
MTKTLHQASNTKHLSPLAADIEAEFGSLRDVGGEGARLTRASAEALRIGVEQAARAMPEAMRQGFIRSCESRLEANWGRDDRRWRVTFFDLTD